MAKKGSKQKSAAGNIHKKDMQVVILADHVNSSPEMNQISRPSCLLEVAGAPVLDYILQCVDVPRISNIVILTRYHREAIESYLKTRKVSTSIDIFSFESCSTFGDWMREIQPTGVLKDYFIVLRGYCLPSIDIEKAILEFESRQKTISSHLMMRIFQKSGTLDSRRTIDNNTCIVTNQSNVIKYYESVQEQKSFSITENTRLKFKRVSELNVRYDLFDTFIAICTTQVLSQFQDNYDYNEERDEFLKDLFLSEISPYEVSSYELEGDEYVRRVRSCWDLWQANQDALKQKIEGKLEYNAMLEDGCPQTEYIMSGGYHSRIAVDAAIDYDVQILRNCLIKSGATVKEGSVIKNTLIEKEVQISKGVTLVDSVIMDGAKIEEGSTIVNSFIGEGVTIGQKSVIKNSIIDREIIIETSSILECVRRTQEEGDIIITKNQAFLNSLPLETDKLVFYGDEEEQQEEKVLAFDVELRDVIDQGLSDQSTSNNIYREIISMRMTYNKSFEDCVRISTPHILYLVAQKLAGVSKEQYLPTLNKEVVFWQPLLSNYCSSEQETAALFDEIEGVCSQESSVYKIHILLQVLYLKQVLTGEQIIGWYERQEADPSKEGLVQLCQQFVEWLRVQGESSDEDESSSEDSGSDDDEDDEQVYSGLRNLQSNFHFYQIFNKKIQNFFLEEEYQEKD